MSRPPLNSSFVRLSASLPLAVLLSGCSEPTGPDGAPALVEKAPWNAGTIVLQNDALRAEIVPAWAGRLMFFGRTGGTNVLWTWPEAAGFTVDGNGHSVWRNVGGEKTWVGSQGAGWRAFAGKKAGIVWPPPAWFDSEPMEVVSADSTNVVLRTAPHRGDDWVVALERSFSLEADALVVRQRLMPESAGERGPEALPDDDRRLWSVMQIPRPDRVFLHLAGEGRQIRDGAMPAPVPIDRPGWTFLDVGGMDGDGKISADGDRLAVPLADGWLVLSQTAPARHLAAFASPGRAMVFASKPDERPSPYAELEFAAYGPDAEQVLEFRIADDPFGPDAGTSVR